MDIIPKDADDCINSQQNTTSNWVQKEAENWRTELVDNNGDDNGEDNTQDPGGRTQEEEALVVDGITQTPELAEEMAWLVDQEYVNPEDEKHNKVQEVIWSANHKIVVARRTNISDNQRDDQWHVVCGREGILENVERFRVENDLTKSQVKWPDNELDFAKLQQEDERIVAIVIKVKAGNAERNMNYRC